MTATEVFVKFLKTELPPQEYLFFMYHLSRKRRNGKCKPVLRKGYVEEYLSSKRRTLGGFMTRLFVICPSLVRYGHNNPLYVILEKQIQKKYHYHLNIPEDEYFFNQHVHSKYVSLYRSKWRDFLRFHIKSEKKIDSPYKEFETYDYEYVKEKMCIR